VAIASTKSRVGSEVRAVRGKDVDHRHPLLLAVKPLPIQRRIVLEGPGHEGHELAPIGQVADKVEAAVRVGVVWDPKPVRSCHAQPTSD